MKIFVSAVAVLVLAVIACTDVFAQNTPVDRTSSKPATRYVPTAADLAYNAVTAGDVAEADVYTSGTALQYTGLVLNGNGVNPNLAHPFLKVQDQTNDGSFETAACYLGNNSSAGSFGLGFFNLSQAFSSAHMRASRSGSTVTIAFTNVNGGVLPNQTYVCTGAPTPPGDKIGVVGFANNTAQIDNFSDGSTILDTFSFVGTLGSTGKWNDAAPGMNANGSRAMGGSVALSFWTAPLGTSSCDIQLNKTTFVNGDQVIAQVLQITNPTAAALAIEFKFWFEIPGIAPVSFARGGADGSVVLPAGFNQNLGPLPLFTVTSAFPRGNYAFNCRFLQPVTGGLLAEDLNSFQVQ